MSVHWAADDPDTARDDCEPVWETRRPDVTDLPDISEWQENSMICAPCAAAADNRLARDAHCDDDKCMCGHRVEQYGTTTNPSAVTADGGEPG